MYTGEILIAVGIGAAMVFVLLIGYLLRSRKRSRLYKDILLQETRAFETFGATSQLMRDSTASASIHVGDSSYSAAAGDSSANAGGGYRTGENMAVADAAESDADATELEFGEIVPDGSAPDGSAPDGSVPDGSVPDGSVPDKSAPGKSAAPAIDWRVLAAQYEYIEEIKGGGMSRIFKALKINTGNEWIVKFIPKSIGAITQEAEILKELNHVNLPSIIDIFENADGQFLVESYIEGLGLDQVLKYHGKVPVFKLLDWAEQITQVLSYLHNRPEPLLHLDLKPSNIMVTHDDRLVLIDFGISRRQSEVSGGTGATLSYAAPEQLGRKISARGQEIIERRFGELPEERANWPLDVRTDIYSLGVILFEAAAGHIPRHKRLKVLRNVLPASLCEIICKCIALDPAERYQTIDELLADLQRQKQHSKSRMQFFLFRGRAAGLATAASFGLAVFGFAMGSHLIDVEARTVMTIDPGILTVSVLQSGEVRLNRLLEDTGESRPLNENNLRWEPGADGIAQVDGNRIVGLNVGETMIHGRYRRNEVSVRVQVVEPMDGIVEIVQRFPSGRFPSGRFPIPPGQPEVRTVSRFAGSPHREHLDGPLPDAEFVAPGSMDISAGGAIYMVDSGVLRRVYDRRVETIEINPPFLVPHTVRTYGNDIFILTEAWQEEAEFFYGIIRLSESGAEGFFLGDALHTNIRDFAVANGLIYLIEWNAGQNRNYLRTIDLADANNIQTLTELPDDVSALAVANSASAGFGETDSGNAISGETISGNAVSGETDSGNAVSGETGSGETGFAPHIFLADSEQGVLLVYNGGITQLAGISGENAFIDGTAPLFYQPSRLRFGAGGLYVWDFNVLRLLRLEYVAAEAAGADAGFVAVEAVSVAGAVSPVYDLEPPLREEPAHEIVLPYSRLMDFIVLDEPAGGILLTDPKRGVVWVT